MRRLWLLLCLISMSSVSWAQEQSPKVAVMPFAVRSQEDTVNTQKTIADLLTRQLSAEGVKVIDFQEVLKHVKSGESVMTEEQGRSLGHRLSADFVLGGSFNQIGNTISLDVKLVDTSGRKKTEILFAEEKGMENLAAATNGITQQAAVHLLSKAVIAEVRVKGNDRIEAEAIKATVKSKKGEVLRPSQVSEDIKAIYKMGFFEKVDADVSDSPAGKVLMFVVQENPTVQEVRVAGNKKIKEKDILAAITTKAYTVLQKNVVSEDVQKIVKLYHTKGFFGADIKSSIEFPKDPRKATVVFNVTEKGKVYIKDITFKGNKNFSNGKLRGVMQTKEKSILSWVTDRGILQRDILETDVDRLTVFYHDRGFMDAKVGTPEVTQREDGFHIEIPVEEGERYKVKDVKMAGDELEEQDKKEVDKNMKIKKADYFSRESLRQDVENISKAYMNEGYAHTEVNPVVKRDPDTDTTDITYDVKKGEKVHIGRIFITGNTKTRDKVIRREIKLNEGDLFSSKKLERSMLSLKKLDYFEEVEIVPSEGSRPGLMDLHVKVKEKLTGSISVGGGYSSDDGLFASGEIMQRNLFGRGSTLGLKLYFGAEAQRYVGSFTEPYVFDTQWTAGLDAYNWIREYSDFTKDAVGFRLRGSYPFGNYSRLNTFYTFEDAKLSDLGDVVGAEKLFLESQEGRHIKSSITTGLERDTTDHPFLPTRGSINTASMEYTSPAMGSDMDFIKSEVHTGWYIPLFWKFVGFVRGEAGYIYQIDRPVLVYERFFLGGINSLRGFGWGEVGPTIEHGPNKGVILGGFKYALGNVELLFPIVEKLGMRGVLFFDAGNAYRKNEDIDVTKFRTDAGAGIRWNSPLGPLRIEWGYNLDPMPWEDQYKWQFSAGAFF